MRLNDFYKNFILFETEKKAYMKNVIPTLLIKIIDKSKTQLILSGVIAILYLYLSFNQLFYQPYYSASANNYRYAVYFSFGSISAISLLTSILGLNRYQITADLLPIIFFVLFAIGYYINKFYYRRTVLNIYMRLSEKDSLEKNLSDDELQYNPLNHKKKTKYTSIERISKFFFFLIYLYII